MSIRRGEIYYANLSPVVGSEQGGERPVLVIQNDVGNVHSETVIVAALTSQFKKWLPVHVYIPAKASGLSHNSIVLCEQLRTISKSRLSERVGVAPPSIMEQVDNAVKISLGIT